MPGTRRHARGPQVALLPTAHARVLDLPPRRLVPSAPARRRLPGRAQRWLGGSSVKVWLPPPQGPGGAGGGPCTWGEARDAPWLLCGAPCAPGNPGPASRRLSRFQVECGNRGARRTPAGTGTRGGRASCARGVQQGGERGWQGQQASAAASEAAGAVGLGWPFTASTAKTCGRTSNSCRPGDRPSSARVHSRFLSAPSPAPQGRRGRMP